MILPKNLHFEPNDSSQLVSPRAKEFESIPVSWRYADLLSSRERALPGYIRDTLSTIDIIGSSPKVRNKYMVDMERMSQLKQLYQSNNNDLSS